MYKLRYLCFVSAPQPRLPIELCEHIIDFIFSQAKDYDNHKTQEALSTCSLVCRAWCARARMHLFKKVLLVPGKVPSLDTILRRNPSITAGIVQVVVSITRSRFDECFGSFKHALSNNWSGWYEGSYDHEWHKWLDHNPYPSLLSSFAIQHLLTNMVYLEIEGLNLTQEHYCLHRAPLFRSVQHLSLNYLPSSQLSQLVRFINSFPSLSDLQVSFLKEQSISHRGQILPKQFHTVTRSLARLVLDLVPGISRLICWFLKAGALLTYLKDLTLCIDKFSTESDYRSVLEPVGELFRHCSSSLESLQVDIKERRYIECLPDLGKRIICMLSSTQPLLQFLWAHYEV